MKCKCTVARGHAGEAMGRKELRFPLHATILQQPDGAAEGSSGGLPRACGHPSISAKLHAVAGRQCDPARPGWLCQHMLQVCPFGILITRIQLIILCLGIHSSNYGMHCSAQALLPSSSCMMRSMHMSSMYCVSTCTGALHVWLPLCDPAHRMISQLAGTAY